MESSETLWRVVIDYKDGERNVQWVPANTQSEAVLRAVCHELEITVIDAVQARKLRHAI